MENRDKTIGSIREFNRFYTVNMGLLNGNYLSSRYSVAETRILFEIDRLKTCIQSDIVNAVKIDKSYLSRIIQKLYNKGLIDRSKTESDKREVKIILTADGKAEVEKLIGFTNERIKSQIENLNAIECDTLREALQTIILILGKGNKDESSSV